MSSMTEIPQVDFATAHDVIKVAMAANQAVLLLGDPGVGKSALAAKVSKDMGLNLAILLGATVDPTDVGGLPVIRVDGKGVDRIPLQLIRDAAERPAVLFLDEISAAPLPVQAAMLRLILERVAGDITLHPETRILAAANPPEQAPGGFDLSAPLMGRLCVLHFRPSEAEVLTHLAGLGDDETPVGKAVRMEAVDFAATAGVAPDLLQIDIPSECVTGNAPWGAPRAWERVIRARAAATLLGGISEDALYASMAGSVGRKAAIAYNGILKMRRDLPSLDEILEEPAKAKVPDEANKQIAALGLISRVADRNLWAAYIYAARLRPEFGQACHKVLMAMAHKAPPLTDKLAKAGVEARVKLTASVKRFK